MAYRSSSRAMAVNGVEAESSCGGCAALFGCEEGGACANAAGPGMLTFVGEGAGDYISETNYKYVGNGAGNMRVVSPTVYLYGRIACLVVAPMLLLLLLLLSIRGPPTTTSTYRSVVSPQAVGECTFWGDPHVQTFDGGRPSFYGDGEFWIVKSEQVSIQGRFMGTSYTKGLAASNKIAVGGAFLRGHVIVVGTLESGEISIDGQPAFTTFPSTQYIPGLAKITYSSEGKLVDQATHIWERRVVRMELPLGVQLEVFRWTNYLDLRLRMPAQPGQDGCCGNYNGDASDDVVEAIMQRIGARVEHGALLFAERAPVVFTGVEEKLLAACAADKMAKGRAECQAFLQGSTSVPTTAQFNACLLDVCFGSNEHALRMAQGMGL